MIALLASVLLLGCQAAPATESLSLDPGQPSLGINLAGLADWSTELPFVDVFRLSREWVSQKEGAAWGQGPKLELDEHGWVKKLEPGTFAETLLCTIEGGHYPSGTYTVLYKGKGEIGFNNAKVKSQGPGKVLIDVESKNGAFFLRILKTDPADYIRDIRVYLPGHTAALGPFNPSLIARWKGASTVRFMDWMATNGSKVQKWEERPKLEDATWTVKGAPVEVMVDLANGLQADPWFCMPHRADDDYVRQFAKVVKDKLDPKCRVYVEYSNETWNSMFEQTMYAGDKGLELKLADKHWEAGWRYTGQRSIEIFKIWESVFGGPSRLVKVLPGFAANDYVSEQVVTSKDAYKHADALAIAPYLGFNISPTGKPSAEEVAGWSLDQLFQELRAKTLPESAEYMRKNAAVAKEYGLKLIAYEGGQHLVGVQGGENNEKMTALFHRANADPRMGAIYDDYFKAWREHGGGTFAYFSSVSNWSKWGSWGVLQYLDEDPSKSAKWLAIQRFAKSCGQFLGASR